MTLGLKLPACEKCRMRKIKCDSRSPKCSACEKTQSACILVDTVSQQRHSRQAISELEEKLRILEANNPGKSNGAPNDDANEHPFIGPGSGIGFLKYLFSTADWVNAQADLLRYLNVRAPLPRANVPAYGLPTLEFTQTMVDDYFLRAHVNVPFLNRRTIQESVQRVYVSVSEANVQDYYRVYMVLAIGSIPKYRQRTIEENPYGFFKAAQRYVPLDKIGTIDGIANILMRARFAAFCHVSKSSMLKNCGIPSVANEIRECSVWDISQLCMRQCVEVGLHRRTRQPLPPIVEQMHRRIFWTCYISDRYSSGILGRPYGIPDHDIDQPLPLLADDDEILASDAQRLDDMIIPERAEPREMAVFNFVIELRRVCSRIQKIFYSPGLLTNTRHVHQISEAGRVYTDARKVLLELSEWKDRAPIFTNPRCLYEHADYHHFLIARDKLFLLRGAMGRMSLSGLHPARDLLQDCLTCATMVIDLYNKLHARQFLTWTRSYFQVIFTAGLSIVFALSTMKLNHRSMDTTAVHDGIAALPQCSSILREFVEEMPDASRFALVFDVLWKKCLKQIGVTSDVFAQLLPAELRNQHHGSRQKSRCQLLIDASMRAQGTPASAVPGTDNAILPQHGSVASSNLDSQRPSAQGRRDAAHGEIAVQPPTPRDFTTVLNAEPDYSQWPLFDESLLQQMEAGLGEMTWGDPLADISLWQDLFSGAPGPAFM